MTGTRILLVSRDPGGTNQVVACRAALSDVAHTPRQRDIAVRLRAILGLAADETPEFAIAAKQYALARWRAIDAAPIELPDAADAKEERDHAARLLARLAPGIVVTATSDQDCTTEKCFWRAAVDAAIPCFALSTHPANIPSRFRFDDGTPVWPTRILVDANSAAAELRMNGVPADRIVVLGDLHLTALEAATAPGIANRVALRAAWGASGEDRVVLFVSECVREMAAVAGRPVPFDESACLARLLQDIAAGHIPGFGTVDPARTLVVVRPHPKDMPGKYAAELAAAGGRTLHSAAGSPVDALHAADVVVGMESTMLYEAEALRYPVVSLVPDGMFARLHASQHMDRPQ